MAPIHSALLKRRDLLADFLEYRPRQIQGHVWKHSGLGTESHEALGIGVRKRAQHHGVDDGEERGICTDTQSERQDGNSGETWIFAEHADAVAAIREDGGEPVANSFFANLFFHLLNPPKFDPRGPLRFLR